MAGLARWARQVETGPGIFESRCLSAGGWKHGRFASQYVVLLEFLEEWPEVHLAWIRAGRACASTEGETYLARLLRRRRAAAAIAPSPLISRTMLAGSGVTVSGTR